jgi:hypothetical protein
MDMKSEGAAFPPVPFLPARPKDAVRGLGFTKDGQELPCEMCGAQVVAYHCKRICLRCGFMTGCSEGI